MSQTITFFLGGEELRVQGVSPATTLLNFLREHRGRTGTKEGCNEGDCGACTVLLAHVEGPENDLVYRAVNACITLLPAVHGHWVVSVEDLGQAPDRLHPVQDAMVRRHGSQCGFCTPGFVMSLAAMHLDGAPVEQAETYIAGNLCRCTGYGPILAAAGDSVAAPEDPAFSAKVHAAKDWLIARRADDDGLFYEHGDERYDAPVTLDALLRLRQDHPGATIVAGTTELGLWLNKDLQDFPHLISPTRVSTLTAVDFRSDGTLVIGGAATYEQAWPKLSQVIPEGQDWFERFASMQIRQQATIGGNIVNASPIGDGPPLFLALNAEVELASTRGSRVVPLAAFFTGYKQTELAGDEVLTSILIPRRPENLQFAALKVSKRRDQDISAVMAVFAWQADGEQLTGVRLGFGGMDATPQMAGNTQAVLEGKALTPALIDEAVDTLASDFSPIDDLRASAWYRMEVSRNLLRTELEQTLASRGEAAAA